MFRIKDDDMVLCKSGIGNPVTFLKKKSKNHGGRIEQKRLNDLLLQPWTIEPDTEILGATFRIFDGVCTKTRNTLKSSMRPQVRKFVMNNETLESRCVPATFGVPWPNPQHITISFAPDGTDIRGQSNELNAHLDSSLPSSSLSPTWKSAILEAFQIWSSKANINFTVVEEVGQFAFGSAGLSTSDSRFGDVRIGGIKLSNEALAISIPFDPAIAGTNAGDIIFNTKYNLTHDDLLAVALHETGHILGLGDSTGVSSALATPLAHIFTLSESDITAVQSLYGPRTSNSYYDQGTDDSPDEATKISNIKIQGGKSASIAFGDITSSSDVDYFSFNIPTNYSGGATIRLKTSGISLLNGKLSVLDKNLNLIGQATITDSSNGSAIVHLDNVTPKADLLLRVEGSGSGFDTGSYGVAVTLDDANPIDPAAIDFVLNGDNLNLSSKDLKSLLSNPLSTYFNDDSHSDDDAKHAVKIDPSTSSTNLATYYKVGSLSNINDVDNYLIKGTSNRGSVMTVIIESMGDTALNPNISLLNSKGLAITSQILFNDGHRIAIQASGIQSTEKITVQVASQTGELGNYRLNAYFNEVQSNSKTFVNSAVSNTQIIKNYALLVAEAQIFQFSSDINSSLVNSSSYMTFDIIDQSGNLVWSHSGRPGIATSGNAVQLNSGYYTIQVKMISTSNADETLSFRLFGDSVSDPVGPGYIDATIIPQFTDPSAPWIYNWPGGVYIDQSYIILEIPDPYYDPYTDTSYLGTLA